MKECKPKKTWQLACARDPDQKLDRKTEYHLNDDAQTEIEKEEIVEGKQHENTLTCTVLNMHYYIFLWKV